MNNKEISILIVEDDEPIRRLLADYLSFHYNCATAASADEATEMLETSSFKLLITDTRMPGASGLELCQFVRHMYPETVVILMLETTDFQWTTEAKRQGAYDYIVKPLDFSKVLDSIERALQHQALISKKRSPQAHTQAVDVRDVTAFPTLISDPVWPRAHGVSACPIPSFGYSKASITKGGSSDKRSAKRVSYLCEVECEGLSISRFTTRINDLSTGGVFIDSMTCFQAGSLFRLKFHVRSTEIIVIGEVRYSMPGIGMGLRFLDLRPEYLAAIESVVEDVSRMEPHHHTAPSMLGSAAI